VFTRACQWSLSWARCIQSTPSHPISSKSILILSFNLCLRLPRGLRFRNRSAWTLPLTDTTCVHKFLYHFLIEFAVRGYFFELSSEFSLNSYRRFRWMILQHTKRIFQLSCHITSVLHSGGKSWNCFLRIRTKKKSSFSLQWREFNFCMTISFLPINLCSRSHHLWSLCTLFVSLHVFCVN
jgi:hypothetical protein